MADDAPLAIMSSLIIDELGSGEFVGGALLVPLCPLVLIHQGWQW